MASQQIRLLAYPTSPYALKVACYLKFKQLDFDFVPVHPVTNREIRFTQQRQVPVLVIDGEWRKESSALGLWLNSLFPDPPLLGRTDEEAQRILAIDRWISDELIPGRFREAYQWESPLRSIRNGWRLASVVHQSTPIPWVLRALWPLLVKQAGFVKRMMKMMDLSEPLPVMRLRLRETFLQHLAGGPFLGGLTEPSLADLSAYPIVVSGYLMGMEAPPGGVLEDPEIVQWCQRVQARLPDNPLLVDDSLIMRAHL